MIFSSRETSWTSCGKEAIFWRTAASPDAAFSKSCRAFTSSSVWVCHSVFKGNKGRKSPRVNENSGNKQVGEHVTEQKVKKHSLWRNNLHFMPFKWNIPVEWQWRLCCEGSYGFCSHRLHRLLLPGSSDSFFSQASFLRLSKRNRKTPADYKISLNYVVNPSNLELSLEVKL